MRNQLVDLANNDSKDSISTKLSAYSFGQTYLSKNNSLSTFKFSSLKHLFEINGNIDSANSQLASMNTDVFSNLNCDCNFEKINVKNLVSTQQLAKTNSLPGTNGNNAQKNLVQRTMFAQKEVPEVVEIPQRNLAQSQSNSESETKDETIKKLTTLLASEIEIQNKKDMELRLAQQQQMNVNTQGGFTTLGQNSNNQKEILLNEIAQLSQMNANTNPQQTMLAQQQVFSPTGLDSATMLNQQPIIPQNLSQQNLAVQLGNLPVQDLQKLLAQNMNSNQ